MKTPSLWKSYSLNAISFAFKSLSWLNLKLKSLNQTEFNGVFIISVDNLSFGGTGKTPMVIELTKLLKAKLNEIRRDSYPSEIAIVSRGYKSSYEKIGIEAQRDHSFKDIGDEAAMFKSYFPDAGVFIGKNRKKSIEAAIKKNYKIIILDDGFQSTNIKKDFEIMLINPLHPYFFLRNFKFLMNQEDLVLVYGGRDENNRDVLPSAGQSFFNYHSLGRIRSFQKYFMINKRKFFARGALMSFPVGGMYYFEWERTVDVWGNCIDIGGLNPLLFGFSALGDNERFENDLKKYRLGGFMPFGDHHSYSQNELDSLDKKRKDLNCDYLICTEKDFIKIKHLNLTKIPLIYPQNSIKFNLNIIDLIMKQISKHESQKSTV